MIHHISIAAHDPHRVATVLGELMQGFALPFPPNPGSFLAVAPDGQGTGIEVHPHDLVIDPGTEHGPAFGRVEPASLYTATHVALSVSLDVAAVQQIAEREGWLCRVCSRGGDFAVVELWLENRFLIEVMPPEFTAGYLAFANHVAEAADPTRLMASHTLP